MSTRWNFSLQSTRLCHRYQRCGPTASSFLTDVTAGRQDDAQHATPVDVARQLLLNIFTLFLSYVMDNHFKSFRKTVPMSVLRKHISSYFLQLAKLNPRTCLKRSPVNIIYVIALMHFVRHKFGDMFSFNHNRRTP